MIDVIIDSYRQLSIGEQVFHTIYLLEIEIKAGKWEYQLFDHDIYGQFISERRLDVNVSV